MLKWLIAEATKRSFTREVFALTSYYLDLYFQKNGKGHQEDLHELALAALMLATKIEGTSFPELGR